MGSGTSDHLAPGVCKRYQDRTHHPVLQRPSMGIELPYSQHPCSRDGYFFSLRDSINLALREDSWVPCCHKESSAIGMQREDKGQDHDNISLLDIRKNKQVLGIQQPCQMLKNSLELEQQERAFWRMEDTKFLKIFCVLNVKNLEPKISSYS